ncbi:uncharacterized protein BXZ73DRAFT_90427 [Epithele typhae]|uniref:uncharacterized protein n=1 Tax=Epithele typhae TaxID=378194 RepID=UPI002008A10B|nr:uncharacterized protein BXZ73DRAFT_90427 [Epithele typhae]KAH9929586.1 hypothetical protein BXZ73DRAFT_90427 [Epithele typhae]
MFSSSLSSALAALFLASSFAAPALCRAPGPFAHLRRSASSHLASRDASDYLDNLLYINKNLTSLYLAIEVQQQTYAAYLDSSWSGLILYDGKYAAAQGNVRTITIDESVQIQVQDGRETVGIFDEEFTVEYFSAGSWPDGLPAINYDTIKSAYLGVDMTQPMNPIYSYLATKWPQDYSKWYYDTLTFYDWTEASPSDSAVSLAGVMVPGETLSWESLSVNSSIVTQYGLPDLNGINSEPYVYTRGDGTIYTDRYIYVSDQQYFTNTSVYQADSSKVVVAIDTSSRWSVMPSEWADAIYGSISGAKVVAGDSYHYYAIPCEAEIKLEISIDGAKYQVFSEVLVAKNPDGSGECMGSIVMPGGGAVDARPEYDVIFGFQFMSAFYYRSGLDQQSNSPYYKFMPIQPSNDNWKTAGAMNGYTSAFASYASSSAYTTSDSVAYATSGSSAYMTSNSSAYATTDSSAYATSDSSAYATSSTSVYDSSAYPRPPFPSTPAYTSSAYSYSSASSSDYGDDKDTLIAQGAVANDGTSGEDSWEKKAKLYEIIIIVLAALLGLGILGGIIAVVSHESKGALYGAEGGSSRYADPYADGH